MGKKTTFGSLLCFMAWVAWADPAAEPAGLTAANTGFAFELMKQIAAEQPNANVFISPFSVSSVLQMLANGAAGDTRTEMQRVLKTTGLAPDSLNTACQALNQSLNSQTNVTLNLANAIWFQEGIRL